jgi:hypothetical protein
MELSGDRQQQYQAGHPQVPEINEPQIVISISDTPGWTATLIASCSFIKSE